MGEKLKEIEIGWFTLDEYCYCEIGREDVWTWVRIGYVVWCFLFEKKILYREVIVVIKNNVFFIRMSFSSCLH